MRINKKGQALIEFVLILPVILFIIFGFVDLGRVILAKSEIENKIVDLMPLVRSYHTNNDDLEKYLENQVNYPVEVEIIDHNETFTILVTAKVSLLTPGLNIFMDDLSEIKLKRVSAYES